MYDMNESTHTLNIAQTASAIAAGEVVAYPTESCFGLGCDPTNIAAIEKIIQLKARSANKGLILIAASALQAKEYVDVYDSPFQQEILNSWPGPNTWLLTPRLTVLPILRGNFSQLAMRVTAHPIASAICAEFGGAIVSTSANLSGDTALVDEAAVARVFGKQIKIAEGDIGADCKPSTIRDGLTGEILRK